MKKIKRLIASVGAFLLAFSITAPSLISASAATTRFEDETAPNITYKDRARYDEYFEMSQDITVHSVKEDGSATLRFPLLIKNLNHYACKSESEYGISFSFTVVRDSEFEKTPIYRYTIMGTPTGGATFRSEILNGGSISTGMSLDSPVSVFPDQLDESRTVEMHFVEDGVYVKDVFYSIDSSYYQNNRLDLIQNWPDFGKMEYYWSQTKNIYSFITDNSGKYPTLYVDVPVMSATANYFISTDIQKQVYGTVRTEQDGIFNQKTYEVDKYIETFIKSPSVNVKSILEDMQESGDLDTVIPEGEKENANNIIQNTATKEVTISYLEQVGRTPFAVRVNKKVTVPILNDNLRYDDVCVALGKKSLTCLGATWKGFEKDTFDVYTAQYLTSTYLQVVDQTGKYDEHYFKLEKSFEEYTSELESMGIFEDGTFDFALNDIKRMYPSMEEYDANEIYGLWGYVVVPETANWTSIFTEAVFKVPEEFNGILKRYEKQGRMNPADYHKLLQEEYDYTWGEAINSAFWTGILNGGDAIDGYSCKHYFFYADPKISDISMEEGTLNNAGKDFIGSVSDTLNGIFENNEEETAKNPFRTILIISGTALGTVGVVAIVFFFKKGPKGR